MGGKRGSSEVKETAAQRAAAEVARKQWDLYQTDFKQFEDNFIERIGTFNSAANMADSKQAADVGYAKAFSKNREAVSKSLAASGVAPDSGKYQDALADMTTEQAVAQSDTINRAQSSEQDKYLAGLSDVTAIGMGQQTGALAGMGDVANASLSKATADAKSDFNRRASNLQLAGTVAGVGLRSYAGQSGGDGTQVDGVSTNSSGLNDYDHFTNPGGSMTA